jgi:hypothetical protein
MLPGPDKKIEWSIGKIKYASESLVVVPQNVVAMIRAIENFHSVNFLEFSTVLNFFLGF